MVWVTDVARIWHLALLWLWRRLVAIAPIRPLAWEPPYAAGAAPEMAERQKKKKKKAAHWTWIFGISVQPYPIFR